VTDPHQILHDRFGFSHFRGVQQQVVERAMAGMHVLAVMPTGAGKSLTYQLPALARRGTGIIISPLIALMHDQVRSAEGFGIRAAALTSLSEDPRAIRDALRDGQLDLLYVAPERASQESFAQLLQEAEIALFGSTRRIASANGATISAPITACCGRCSTASATCRDWR